MQRRLRITLAVVAATGALALGAGTAAADPLGDILGGANSNSPTASSSDRGDNSDADSSDNNGNSNASDGTDGDDGNEGGADGRDGSDDTNTSIAPNSEDHHNKVGDDSGSDDN
jgi:hypothetical protein